MATSIIEDERIHWRRTGASAPGAMVLYWMQQAQRARDNPALEFGVKRANELGVPLVVVFCVVADYPEASVRHYHFMLEGLSEVRGQLARRGIGFQAIAGNPASVVGGLLEDVSLLVLDRGYLPVQRRWRDEVTEAAADRRPDLPVVEIETDAVVPIDLVSDGVEVAARTIRPKIQRHLDRFVVELRTTPLEHHAVGEGVVTVDPARRLGGHEAVDLDDLDAALDRLGVAADPGRVRGWTGGTTAAFGLLDRFLDEVLPDYRRQRQRYDREHSSSQLSPHLHFGQISPVEVVRRARLSGAPEPDVEAFVDELVVRRELAINFVVHETAHDRFGGLPRWAAETLRHHRDDRRDVVLTATQLEAGDTPDEVWNAIMAEIRDRGWVHNQLRMYWGKQILRWTNTPEHAFRTLLELNNRYFLDGRDANSYANVAWCFGRHDQGFPERQVLGKVRPFTTRALDRKGDLDGWLAARSPG